MAHSRQQWNNWGVKIPYSDHNLVAIDVSREGSPLVLLPADGANQPLPQGGSPHTAKMRANRGDFHCPVPGCGPFATTVSNPRGRDFFRHHKATDLKVDRLGHDPESLEHLSAKHVIAEWMKQVLDNQISFMQVDEYRVCDRFGKHIEPDVYVELVNGVKIAVEYQRSRHDLNKIVRKTKTYRSLGICPLWLFSPGKETCVVVRKQDLSTTKLQVALLPEQKDLASIGADFFWFDYVRERIATPQVFGRIRFTRLPGEAWGNVESMTSKRYSQKPRSGFWEYARLDSSPLSECSIDLATGKLVTPGVLEIQKQANIAEAEIRTLRKDARRRYEHHKQQRETVSLVQVTREMGNISEASEEEKSAATLALALEDSMPKVDFARPGVPGTILPTGTPEGSEHNDAGTPTAQLYALEASFAEKSRSKRWIHRVKRWLGHA